ncbi:MAG: hypothetical protein LBR92_00550 [Puniceicoccales bacterium]|jgi:hypothetical protein|nr:hypothetical protein [Puniceicoccales bacterium]
MSNDWSRSIYFLIFAGIFQGETEGRRNQIFNGFSSLRAIETEENTKEVRHFSKIFRGQKRYNKRIKISNPFERHAKLGKKEFNMHTLNRPFARRARSSKIGKIPLHKLPNKNK